jgi:nitrite reductase/ring-hydroxylating ferredoxin subunit
MSLQRLCALAELDGSGAKGLTVSAETGARELFIVREGVRVYAYENACPHTGGPLDWMPDQFLDDERKLIVCATHAALFRVNDGYCVARPCAGARLRAVAVEIDDKAVFLTE